jgi:hypothetical protein
MTNGQMTERRKEAWALLRDLARQREGLPDPNTWVQSRAIFSKPEPAETATLRLKVDLLRAQAQPRVEAVAQLVMYETTFFNMVAADTIRLRQFNIRATTARLMAEHVREIEFPPGSQALKTFWYRLPPAPDKLQVQIWDWAKMADNVTQLPPGVLSTKCIQRASTNADCLAAQDNFYTLTVTDPTIFSCGDSCASDLKAGDVLLLVAMHVASKQTPEWMWATFWWRGPDSAPMHGSFWTCGDAQRQVVLGGVTPPWSNYSMDVTRTFRLAKPLPDSDHPACGLPGRIGADEQYLAAYNPFVEASFNYGLKSSCIDCHARASTNSSLPENLVPKPNSVDGHPALRDFEGHIRTDYLWSLRRGLAPTFWPPIN